MAKDDKSKKDRRERREVREHMSLKAPLIYEVVREEGEEELTRPLMSLWWSGVAAGLAICMSIVSESALRRFLPDTPWSGLIAHFGYCVGFVIVVLGRLQLFTENTVTAVLPCMAQQTLGCLLRMLRLWVVVFAANVFGAMIFALATVYIGFFPEPQFQEMLAISEHLAAKPWLDMMLSGVAAGFLIAAMVWLLPSAGDSGFWVVILMTYIIAISDLAHVVAGSAEIFLLVAHGDYPALQALTSFLVPAFIGNVIGGTALFALLAYGQVMEEL